jgi:class 3 adenylate cyclase
VTTPDTRYARTPDGAYIAYQVVGEGPVDLVWQFDFFGNVDVVWEQPRYASWWRELSSFTRLILHDRRGTGLSSRNVPVPDLETRVQDLRCVLDAVGSERVVLGGHIEGGAPNVLFASTDPERVSSIVWWEPNARAVATSDYPWGAPAEHLDRTDEAMRTSWGTAEYGARFVEAEGEIGAEHSDDPAMTGFVAKISRHTGTPDVGLALSRVWRDTDVRAVLPAVTVPALLMTRRAHPEEALHIASLMPNATVELFGGTSIDQWQEQDALVDAIRRWVGVEPLRAGLDTILSTVLFTDIVGSTERQAALGDRAWKELVLGHHAVVRDALGRWHGIENDTAGDGFYATFDGPARAIRCAREICERVRDLGIEVRAGIHTGECEVIDSKCGGLTVSIGARVAGHAGPSEVLVTQTVKDLVAGSGLTFEGAGEHELKGVPDRWRLYRVVS